MKNGLFFQLGNIVSGEFGLNWDENKKKNFGIIVSEFLDFSDYFTLDEHVKNEKTKAVIEKLQEIFKNTDTEEIKRKIVEFVGKEKSETYMEAIDRIRQWKKS